MKNRGQIALILGWGILSAAIGSVCPLLTAHAELSLEEQMQSAAQKDLQQGFEHQKNAAKPHPISTGYPLEDAILNNDMAALLELIKQGKDVNAVDQQHHTPIYVAIGRQSLEAMKILLEHGANVNAKNELNVTPLLYSIVNAEFGGDAKILPVVKILIDKGADVNARDLYDNAPLQSAYRQARLDVTYLLLQKGANPNVQTNQYGHDTILHMVARQSPKQFLDDFNMKIIGQPVERATMWPHELKDQIAFAKLLIEKGADVNAVEGINKSTPVMIALKNKNYPLVDLLLSKRATLQPIQNDSVRTENPVDMAIRQKDIELLKYLFSKGARLSTTKDSGTPSLSLAVQTGSIEMVDFLLQQGADINEKCSFSGGEQTPIFFALRPANLPMVKYLVEHGANLKITSGLDTTPLHAAVENRADIETIKYMIDKGSDVNSKKVSWDRMTILQSACKIGYKDAAKLLVQRGAKIQPNEIICY